MFLNSTSTLTTDEAIEDAVLRYTQYLAELHLTRNVNLSEPIRKQVELLRNDR
ncbi:MAG: hypothetical protein ACLUR5_16230 [Eubacterium ventriosum]